MKLTNEILENFNGIVNKYGSSFFYDKVKSENLLKDAITDDPLVLNLLINTMKSGIVEKLLSKDTSSTDQLVNWLVVRARIQKKEAEWAIQVWRYLLGISTDIPADILDKNEYTPVNTNEMLDALISEKLKELNSMFVQIPAGVFFMGSKDSDNTKPVHRVVVKAFEIMKYPMTQSLLLGLFGVDRSYFEGANRPAECVSWNDCQEFIKQLNQLDPKKGYRLPTEAEWEYACKAGSTSNIRKSNKLEFETKEVGLEPPNKWGLYDMLGNVWEWCEDDWHDNYEGAPADGSAWLDDEKNQYKVIRGGSWRENEVSSSMRDLYNVNERTREIGFRLVRNVSSTISL